MINTENVVSKGAISMDAYADAVAPFKFRPCRSAATPRRCLIADVRFLLYFSVSFSAAVIGVRNFILVLRIGISFSIIFKTYVIINHHNSIVKTRYIFYNLFRNRFRREFLQRNSHEPRRFYWIIGYSIRRCLFPT